MGDFCTKDGYIWFRINTFCDLFSCVHECRLVGSYKLDSVTSTQQAGPPRNSLVALGENSSGYMGVCPCSLAIYPNSPLTCLSLDWEEHLWCYPGHCSSTEGPVFRIEIDTSVCKSSSRNSTTYADVDNSDDTG